MYQAFTFYHSFFRWILLTGLISCIYAAFLGHVKKSGLAKSHYYLIGFTVFMALLELITGMMLYAQSHITKYFWSDYKKGIRNIEVSFFSLVHSALMITAILSIIIGWGMARRKRTDGEKSIVILIWFTIALMIILIAIPWPFSPLIKRPYLR